MTVKLMTLGQLRLAGSGFARTKPLLLLAYLALEGAKDRRHLAELFWPDSLDPSNSLTAAVKQLKQGAPGSISGEKKLLHALVSCDATEFLTASETGHDEEATSLYGGPFLSGVHLPGWNTDLEDWVHATRERLSGILIKVLLRLGEREAARGEVQQAETHLLQALHMDPLAEEVLQAYLRVCARVGRRDRGLQAYHAFEERLWQALELRPLAFTTHLAQELRDERPAVSHFSSMEDTADTAWTDEAPSPSVTYQNGFIGRQQELAALAQLLNDPTCRLLTLLGPGGIGKTSLALKAAGDQRDLFPDGVQVGMLASVPSPDLLASAIAEALGVHLDGRHPPRTQVLRHLRPKRMLLVLDNVEHLQAGAALLSDITAAAPGVKLLLTSREQLGLKDEWHFSVEGLEYPAHEGEDLEHSEAAQLFLRCARRNDSRFNLTLADRPYLLKLCQFVQGMPLALELAASWVSLLSLQEIADELVHGTDLPAVSPRDLPERHHSLHAVFESSWSRLGVQEQTLLARLSVFHGGFSQRAAEVVAGASLMTLLMLHRKSLLKRVGPNRYALHELIRQYAFQKLSGMPDERDAVLAAHQGYYLAHLAQRETDLAGMQQREAAEVLTAEFGNVRTAWDHAVTTGNLLALGRCASGMGLYLHRQGRLHEAEGRFRHALERLNPEPLNSGPSDADPLYSGHPDATQGEAREALGELLRQHGLALSRLERYPEAVLRLQQSIDQLRRTAATEKLAAALTQLGEAAWHIEGGLRSEGYFRESLRLARAASSRAVMADALRCLGNIAKERLETHTAERYFLASLRMARQVDRPLSLLQTLHYLANHVCLRGDYRQGETYRAEALTLSRSLGHRPTLMRCLRELSYTLISLGRFQQAERCLQETLSLSREVNDLSVTAECLRNLSLLQLEQGDTHGARRLLDEALAAARNGVQPWVLANTLRDMGQLADMQGEHAQALEHTLESLGIFERLNEAHSVGDTLLYLGKLKLRTSCPQAARHYHAALTIALKGHYQSIMTDALVAVAELCLRLGDAAQARDSLLLALQHPATNSPSRNHAQALLARLGADPPAAPEGPPPDLYQGARHMLQLLEPLLE